MPLDRHARRFLEMLSAAGQSRGRYEDVEERRAALVNLADQVDPPGSEAFGGVRRSLDDGEWTAISPCASIRRWASRRASCPASCTFTAAGWVAGSLETHDGLCRRLSNETGCRVIAGGLPAGRRNIPSPMAWPMPWQALIM